MHFKAKKEYGESKIESCPFCGRMATQKSEQGLAVCPRHVKIRMDDRKCVCGQRLEFREGKFGPYFNCIKCGNISFDKGMKISTIAQTPVVQNNLLSPAGKPEPIKIKRELKSSLYEEEEIV